MKAEGCVWAFDLGKGSIGEAVRNGNVFLHKASLVPARAPFHTQQNKTGEDCPRRLCLRNALVTFVTNWCKRLALRFSSLRYLTLS